MENVGVKNDFWQKKRVLLTGHTGFKGGWLSLWLQEMGAELFGLALQPTTNPSFFSVADVAMGMASEIIDIRDFNVVNGCIQKFRPEIIFHLAAQPLVRFSYANPIETYSTNVMGTVHLLEAARLSGSVRVVINVTTDKCYENKEWIWPYRENDVIGGRDPYSSSKGCAELLTSAYRRSYYESKGIGLASVRAGNVIGGGDWSADRLVPDALKSFHNEKPVLIRNPSSTRPWQHVLDPLSGYLRLAEQLWADPIKYSGGWNFGPEIGDVKTVGWIVEGLASCWGLPGSQRSWIQDQGSQPYESKSLTLDISKAVDELSWRPRIDIEKALKMVVDWEKTRLIGGDMKSFTTQQIHEFNGM